MKQNILPITLLLLSLILGCIVINRQRSQVRYVETDCPYCGASEVADFGLNDNGEQRAHCFRCSSNYTFINQ